jgi:hypothetical protein
VLSLDDVLLHHEADCLSLFVSHVDAPVALTGGVAIALHAKRYGLKVRKSTADRDIDFVASDLAAIRPTATADFLVSHYHRPQPKFLLQLVDPINRVRIDVFPDLTGSIAHAEEVHFRDYRVRVLTPEAILAHKVQTLESAVAQGKTVDPKHFDDATLLGKMFGLDPPNVPKHLLKRDVRSLSGNSRCPKCETSSNPSFALAPKERILEILGHL